MTYEQIVANVERLRKLVSEARNRLNAELQLLAQWEAARNTDLANGASPVTIQNTVNRLAQVQANVARYREELATLESDLAKAVQLRDQVDAAMAKLIGEGVPPEVAAQQAASNASRVASINKVLVVLAVVAAALAIGWGVVTFIRWRRSKK
jgi:chromosome segregation ATPase